MKASLITLIAALTATALAVPNPNGNPDPGPTPEPIPVPADAPYLEARSAEPDLDKRKPCYYPSTCSWFNAAKCEHYCRRNGAAGYETVEVNRMEKCNFLNEKRCCCSR